VGRDGIPDGILLPDSFPLSGICVNGGADAHGGALWARRPPGRPPRDLSARSPQKERARARERPGGLPYLISARISPLGNYAALGRHPGCHPAGTPGAPAFGPLRQAGCQLAYRIFAASAFMSASNSFQACSAVSPGMAAHSSLNLAPSKILALFMVILPRL
jgi:hypothetical protein